MSFYFTVEKNKRPSFCAKNKEEKKAKTREKHFFITSQN